MRLEQACSASSNLVAGRKAWTRPCVGSCEVSMDALLTGYWPAASPNSHSWVTTVHWLDEWLRAEARVLNLDRTPWHMTWVGVRPQRARRRLDRARVSARTLPVERSWSFRRRAPRHGCQPCLRGSRLSSRVPPALSLSASRLGWRHALDEGSPADGNVSRAGDECGGVGVGTERRFDEARLAGAPHESVQTCHTPLASEVGRRPWRDPQEMPHPSRTYTPPMRR